MHNHVKISLVFLLFIIAISTVYGQNDLLTTAERKGFLESSEAEKRTYYGRLAGKYRDQKKFDHAEKLGQYAYDYALQEEDIEEANGVLLFLAKLMHLQAKYSKALEYCYKILDSDLDLDQKFKGKVYALKVM
ncbi:MAG: hypothetical protein GY810_25270 [Aureispira sp.]|nr:hypothetical protein [Aureispira sp.]